jgi:LysR family glycine cleavage system transcriptional activator
VTSRLPSLESLRYLEACVRLENFSEAAQELAISPAAVSLRIRNLEKDLGLRLFRRHGPRIAATPAARQIAAAVAKALKLLDAAISGAAARLRVTCVPSLGGRWLASRLHGYHRQADAVPIDLDIASAMRGPDDVDVAIRTGSGDWPGWEADLLMPLSATPMLSPALAAKVREPADLARLPLLAHPSWPQWFEQAGAGGRQLKFYPDEYPTHDLDATAAVAGVGVALLSPVIFAPLLAEGKLAAPFAMEIREQAAHYVLRHPGEDRPAVLSFIRWLKTEARESGPSPRPGPNESPARTRRGPRPAR